MLAVPEVQTVLSDPEGHMEGQAARRLDVSRHVSRFVGATVPPGPWTHFIELPSSQSTFQWPLVIVMTSAHITPLARVGPAHATMVRNSGLSEAASLCQALDH